jgi:hypothetical protein
VAICPFATLRLIAPPASDPRIVPRVSILHVDAGNAESLYDYFKNRSGGIESHFHIKRTGEIEQYRDTDFQADANLDANDFAVSIETQGFGEGEWTPEQIEAIKRLLRWLSKVHDIPLRKIQRWDGAGVGYHTLFGAPSHWTPVAKSCPGPDRKVQFEKVIVPWMADGGRTPVGPSPTPNITAALQADTREERIAALKLVIAHGDDEASQAASIWLEALRAIKKAQRRATAARADLKDEEIRP